MHPIRTAAMIGALALTAPVAAIANPYLQPAGSPILVYAYPSKANYCPAGLQPVTVGGVICCGVPNAHGYNPNPPTHYRKPAAPYVAYSKGYVYEKGQ